MQATLMVGLRDFKKTWIFTDHIICLSNEFCSTSITWI